jgi:hypothetical protein
MSTSGKQKQKVNPKKASGGLLPKNVSGITAHGIGELNLIGEDPKIIVWYISVLEAFSALKHTPESAAHTSEVLARLFRYENLYPLTNNPKEWQEVKEGVWQSLRSFDAYSTNGGKTYKLFSENNDVEHATLDLEKTDAES